jgi:hypothetical protein
MWMIAALRCVGDMSEQLKYRPEFARHKWSLQTTTPTTGSTGEMTAESRMTREAEQEGVSAFWSGEDKAENPYDRYDHKVFHDAWNIGWDRARHDSEE